MPSPLDGNGDQSADQPTVPRYHIAFATLVRNEARWLPEWLAYHVLPAVGVEHFYLYDDSSSDQLRTTIGPHVTRGLVTLYSRFDVTMGLDGPRRNASGSHMMVAGESSRAGREQCNYRKRHGLYHVWDKGTCYIGLLFPLQSYMVAHAIENHGEDAAYLGFFDVDVRAPVANKHSLRYRPKCATKSAGVRSAGRATRDPHRIAAGHGLP